MSKQTPTKSTDTTNSEATPSLRTASRVLFYAYPVLFALFPIMSFVNANSEQLIAPGAEFLKFLSINLIALAAIYIVSLIIFRDLRRTAIFSTIAILLILTFGRADTVIETANFLNLKNSFGPTRFVTIVFALILGFAGYILLRSKHEGNLIVVTQKLAATMGLVLVLTNIGVVPKLFESAQSSAIEKANNKTAETETRKTPDIYHIVLDGHPREDVLKSVLKHDNSDFTGGLEKAGFYVADNAISNYSHTFLSLPSMLNYEYVNYYADQLGEESRDNVPPLLALTNNKLVPELKEEGYQYINLGTGWFQTDKSPYTDITFESRQQTYKLLGIPINLDEFSVTYLNTTLFGRFVTSDARNLTAEKVLDAYQHLLEVPEIKAPTYTFAHVTVPHPPFLFDREGNIVEGKDFSAFGEAYSNVPNFLDQTKFIDDLTLKTVKEIIERSGSNPPVIIVSSDHGSTTSLGHPFSWGSPEDVGDTGIWERQTIVNSFYFPDKDYSMLHEGISPVNTYRVILNKYFSKNLEILEDRSYYSNYKNFYEFFDVTEQVREKDGA